MIQKVMTFKDVIDPVIDAPATSYTISGSLIALPFTLDGLSTVMSIILAAVGITVGYYRIQFERRQIAKLEREENGLLPRKKIKKKT